MPADQLNPRKGTRTVNGGNAAANTTDAVLSVLAGIPLPQAAAHAGIEPSELTDAVEIFRNAGLAALRSAVATGIWYQTWVEFTDWDAAEHVAANRLLPALERLAEVGTLGSWWFIRKAPCWRMRFQPGKAASLADMTAAVTLILDGLTADGLLKQWRKGIYEPEISAFGGEPGIRVAHDLFHADSALILDYARQPDSGTVTGRPVGRRELSILLCSSLMRAAGQEWHEQGDIWDRVRRMRPWPSGMRTDRLHSLGRSARILMTVSTSADSELCGPGGPLEFARPWLAAFTKAGHLLGEAASDGTLERGIRDVLAHHVIFHWNRLGLTDVTQGILAPAAFDVVMQPRKDARPSAPAAAQ